MKPARGKKAAKEEPKSEAGSVEAAAGPGLAQTGHASRTQLVDPTGEQAAPISARVPTVDAADEVAKDAYVVSLPVFQGPLDLLLEIIQKHELDIMDIPMGFVTEKYLEYLKLMQSLTIDVASEYLVMAATLTLIKSRELLPDGGKSAGATDDEEEEELDPRAELVRRLLEYQRYKAAGETLTKRDTLGTAVFPRGTVEENVDIGPAPFATFGVLDLLGAFKKILEKTKVRMDHEVVFDRIGITERIVELTELLKQRRSVAFEDIFSTEGHGPTRFELVITFLAVLEMCRMRMMRIFQVDALSSIHVELLVVDEGEGEGDSGANSAAELQPQPQLPNALESERAREPEVAEDAEDAAELPALEAELAAGALAEAAQVAVLEAELAATTAADAELEQEVPSVEPEVLSVEPEVLSVEPEVLSVEPEVLSVEQEVLSEPDAELAALEAEIAALERAEAEELAALEAEIAALDRAEAAALLNAVVAEREIPSELREPRPEPDAEPAPDIVEAPATEEEQT